MLIVNTSGSTCFNEAAAMTPRKIRDSLLGYYRAVNARFNEAAAMMPRKTCTGRATSRSRSWASMRPRQ